MALPVYTDPNAAGVYDPEGDDIKQALLAEALRAQTKRQQQAQAGAYQPMGGQMVGTPRYQHYVPDYGAGFRSAANIMGANSEAKGAQGAFDTQAQARAKRTQDEFDKWKLQQPKAAAVAPPVAALPQTMDSLGGTQSPKAPGAGFQQAGYSPDEDNSLPVDPVADATVDMGISEAADDDEEDELPDSDDFQDFNDVDLSDEDQPAEETPAEDTAAVDSTSIGQNVTPTEPSMLRTAFEGMQDTRSSAMPQNKATPAGAGVGLAQQPNDEKAMWLLQGMQNFPKLRSALGHDYANQSNANKKRAPINLGQGVLYDPNTGQYLSSGEFLGRTEHKSDLKREEQYLQFLNQRDLELLRQQGKAKSFGERSKFEQLRADIARERIISQEKVARIKASAKTGAANAIAGAIRGNKIPADTRKGIQTSRQNRARAEEALSELEAYSDAVGIKGMLPDAILQRTDSEGVTARAAIADLGSMIVHDRSGAAVTAAEFPRLQPFIPSPKDSYETAKKKLVRFIKIYKEYEENWENMMGESFGGEKPAAKGKAPGSSSSPTYKYDAHGNPMR